MRYNLALKSLFVVVVCCCCCCVYFRLRGLAALIHQSPVTFPFPPNCFIFYRAWCSVEDPPPIWRPSINVSLAVGNEIVFQIFRDTLSVDEKGRKPVFFQGPGTLTDRKCIGLLRFFFWLDLENLQSGSFPLAKQVKCVFFSRCQ